MGEDEKRDATNDPKQPVSAAKQRDVDAQERKLDPEYQARGQSVPNKPVPSASPASAPGSSKPSSVPKGAKTDIPPEYQKALDEALRISAGAGKDLTEESIAQLKKAESLLAKWENIAPDVDDALGEIKTRIKIHEIQQKKSTRAAHKTARAARRNKFLSAMRNLESLRSDARKVIDSFRKKPTDAKLLVEATEKANMVLAECDKVINSVTKEDLQVDAVSERELERPKAIRTGMADFLHHAQGVYGNAHKSQRLRKESIATANAVASDARILVDHSDERLRISERNELHKQSVHQANHHGGIMIPARRRRL